MFVVTKRNISFINKGEMGIMSEYHNLAILACLVFSSVIFLCRALLLQITNPKREVLLAAFYYIFLIIMIIIEKCGGI